MLRPTALFSEPPDHVFIFNDSRETASEATQVWLADTLTPAVPLGAGAACVTLTPSAPRFPPVSPTGHPSAFPGGARMRGTAPTGPPPPHVHLVGLPGLHPRPCWVLLQLFSPNICKRNLIYRGHEKMTPRVLELLGRWVLGVATEAAGLPSSFCTVKSRGCAVQWDPPCPTTTGQTGKPGSRASLREAGGHVRSGPSPPRGA